MVGGGHTPAPTVHEVCGAWGDSEALVLQVSVLVLKTRGGAYPAAARLARAKVVVEPAPPPPVVGFAPEEP